MRPGGGSPGRARLQGGNARGGGEVTGILLQLEMESVRGTACSLNRWGRMSVPVAFIKVIGTGWNLQSNTLRQRVGTVGDRGVMAGTAFISDHAYLARAFASRTPY